MSKQPEKQPASEEKIEEQVVSLAEHKQPGSYRALNGETWPTYPCSHVRLNNGKLVNLDNHINRTINKALAGFAEGVGDAFKAREDKLDTRYEECERKLDEAMRSYRLSIDEEIAEMRGYRDEVHAQMASLRSQLAAMEQENNLLRQSLTPDKVITTADAISMLRNVRRG